MLNNSQCKGRHEHLEFHSSLSILSILNIAVRYSLSFLFDTLDINFILL